MLKFINYLSVLFLLTNVFAQNLITNPGFEDGTNGWDDLAKTPPMGWNSWNKFQCDVSEKLIREAADAMVTSGMKWDIPGI